MKKITAIFLHLIFWTYKFGWVSIMKKVYTPHAVLNDFFSSFAVSEYIYLLTTFYINYFIIMPLFFKKGQNLQLIISWILLIAYFISLRYFIEEYLYLKWYGFHNYYDGVTSGYYIADNIYYAGSIIIPSIVIYIIVHWMKVEKEQLVLKETVLNAEVNFLKSQVNPHFVFNTLNNIYSLVYHKSEKALPAIMRLSELMRYMTTETAVDRIYLDKEIKYIDNFLELESLRVNGEAHVEFKVTGETSAVMITPLLLIPFVENGFKHGIVTDANSPFIIELTVKDNLLHLHTSNKINQSQKDSSSGIGLQNVKRRLQLIYPGKYELKNGKEGDHYICNLSINL
jgi:two-component system LytT family sensor kinase